MAERKEIIREKVWIDPKIVCAYNHGSNSTKYCTCKEKKADEIIKDSDLRTGACFSQLLSMLKTDDKDDRIYYKMEEDIHQKVKLTDEEKHHWIELCVTHGTMPDYITIGDIDKKVMVLKIVEDLTPSLIFIYLCCFRYYREDTGFVRAMVYLVNKCGMNYYAAFVFATRVCINYDLHHILTGVRRYGDSIGPEEAIIRLSDVIGLSRFLKNPKKYDSRGPRSHKNTGSFNQFQCASTIEKISSVRHDCKVQDLFDLNILKAISAENDSDSKEYLDGFLADKNGIV
jgi:hypothetical protein